MGIWVAVEILFVNFHLEKVIIVGVGLLALLDHVLLSHCMQGLSLVKFLDCLLESFQSQNQDCDVVERATDSSLSQAHFNTFSRGNMLIVVESALLTLLLRVTARW